MIVLTIEYLKIFRGSNSIQELMTLQWFLNYQHYKLEMITNNKNLNKIFIIAHIVFQLELSNLKINNNNKKLITIKVWILERNLGIIIYEIQ